MKQGMIKIEDMKAVCLGIIGGIYSTLMNINLPTDFWSKLFEAVLTALVCGAAGWAGKLVAQTGYRALKSYFTKRKKQNNGRMVKKGHQE